MKGILKRVLLVMLVLMLALPAVVSTAGLAEGRVVPKGNTFEGKKMTTYTGMVTALTVYDANGNQQDPSAYKWKTSNKKIVKVSSTGVITAMKTGSAKITATNKSNKKDKTTLKVTVKKNKIDNINAKPSVSAAPYGYINLILKSVEIVAPKKVKVEYYLVWNNYSRYRSTKLKYVDDNVFARNATTGVYTTLVDGKAKNIKVSMRGGSVKKVKVTYSGSKVVDTNICLPDYAGMVNHDRSSLDAQLQFRY